MFKLYVVVAVVVLPESEEVTVAPGRVNTEMDHQRSPLYHYVFLTPITTSRNRTAQICFGSMKTRVYFSKYRLKVCVRCS